MQKFSKNLSPPNFKALCDSKVVNVKLETLDNFPFKTNVLMKAEMPAKIRVKIGHLINQDKPCLKPPLTKHNHCSSCSCHWSTQKRQAGVMSSWNLVMILPTVYHNKSGFYTDRPTEMTVKVGHELFELKGVGKGTFMISPELTDASSVPLV